MMGAINWSIFGSHAASRVTRGSGDWSDLLSHLKSSGPHPNKASCPWIKMALFGDHRTAGGSLRNNENVQVVYGLEGDYDGGLISVDEAISRLESHNIRGAVYTSPSHTPEKPRWRVLAPLNSPCLPEQRSGLLARLNGALGGVLAGESFTLSQSYYYGQVDGAPEYRVAVTFDDPDDGVCIDELPELDAIAKGRTSAAPVAAPLGDPMAPVDPADAFKQRVQQLGRRLKTGDGRRDLLKSFVASRVGRGIRGDDIMTMVHGMCATYFDPADPIDDRDIETIQSWAQTRDDKRIEDGATLAAALLPKPVPVENIKMKVPEETARKKTPAYVEKPPGMLGTITDWVNATSRKPQPAFAVQTAIAFASTVLGRRYVSSQRNWPSLFLLNIGKSASGKEHGKWAVEKLLEACELAHLIGPSSYTSNAGVLSALHDQPAHLTVIDEFGKALENASVKNNARDRSMLTALMEVWGRADGVLRPQGYSTFGMSARDAASFKERTVRNPALSLLAMTTPESFFESLGSAAARDGFLNRFLIVESDIGRQVGQHRAELAPPESVRAWAAQMRRQTDGALVNPDGNATLEPSPTLVPMLAPALELFHQFEIECVGLMDEYEQAGLAEMFGRSNEIAMRLALVVALGCHCEAIDGPHAAWAINYVRHHALRTVERLLSSVADSEFEHSKKQVLSLIVKAGPNGMTERDLSRASTRFARVPQRQQVEILNSLQFVGEICRVEIPTTSGRGRKRVAWIAVSPEEDDAQES